MVIVNILYVTFIVIPTWVIISVLWLLTDILLLLTRSNSKGLTWSNFNGEVAGSWMGFIENIVEAKEFY